MIKLTSFASGAVLAAGLTFACDASAQAPTDKGRAAYVKHGCWQCHGFAGQGGIAGPKLAPEPMAFDAMSAFIRNTRGAMPRYSEQILPAADLADIHTFLRSIPAGPDYRNIPLLGQ